MSRSTKSAGSQHLPHYRLVNPHDAYEFDAADDEVASAAVLLLGGGWYSWQRTDGRSTVEGPLPAGREVESAAQTEVLERVLDDRRAELVACLRSFEIDPSGRAEADAEIGDWHAKHLSSSVDVRGGALETAAVLEAGG